MMAHTKQTPRNPHVSRSATTAIGQDDVQLEHEGTNPKLMSKKLTMKGGKQPQENTYQQKCY